VATFRLLFVRFGFVLLALRFLWVRFRFLVVAFRASDVPECRMFVISAQATRRDERERLALKEAQTLLGQKKKEALRKWT